MVTEVVWTVFVLLGTIANLMGVRSAQLDHTALVDAGKNGPHRMAATQSLRREWVRFSAQLLFLLVGIVALFQHGILATVARILISVALIAAVGLLAISSLLERFDRHRLLAAIDEHEKEE